MLTIDPALFAEDAISTETRTFNEALLARLEASPDMWQYEPAVVRQARLDGKGTFPIEPTEPSARNLLIDTDYGTLSMRAFEPKKGDAKGTYLHIHGGGWTLGSAQSQDVRLQEIADNCQLHCLSVDYRLAPENPFPAAPDDCEMAAHWLLNNSHDLNTSFLAIGGESAGAHLSVLTLLRLQEKLGTCPFHAANLTAGVYDLGHTASAKNWGLERLVLSTRDMQMFAACFLQGGEDTRDAGVSPLYAVLEGLPPALFSVGTKDALLDDTLAMATRWHAANGNAQLDVTPGGCHVFQSFRDLKIAQTSNHRIDTFLNSVREQIS